jgi:hypothetical protein
MALIVLLLSQLATAQDAGPADEPPAEQAPAEQAGQAPAEPVPAWEQAAEGVPEVSVPEPVPEEEEHATTTAAPPAQLPPPQMSWAPSPRCAHDDDCREHGLCQSAGADCVALSNFDCWYSTECAEHGRCTASGSRCIAGRHEDCRRSRACSEDGDCWVFRDEQKCAAGSDYHSVDMRNGGIALMAIGGAAAVAGIFVMLAGIFRGIGGGGGGNTDTFIEAGGGLVIGGGLTILAIGLPLLLVGRRAAHRGASSLAPRVYVGPGSASLHWSF